MLARYDRIANERLYERCSALSDSEYPMNRAGLFGSIHALLNHILLGDRIWMSRFEGGGQTTPPLNTIVYEDFPQLRDARVAEDARIEAFFGSLHPASPLNRSPTSTIRASATWKPRQLRSATSSITRHTIADRFM